MTGNTPGIPKRPIPSLKPSTTRASSVSSSAKSAATSGLNGAKKTQVFHRNLGQNGSVFGGGWQPAARGFNPHDPVSANVNRYAALRQQANMYNTGGMYNFGQVTGHNHSGTDKMAEVMAWTQLGVQALNMAGEMTTDIIELAQANKAAAPGATVAKAAIPTANTVSSANASLVSNMTEAKDAASLESAIKHAQAKANEIGQSLEELKTDAERATAQKAELEETKQQKLEKYNELETSYKEAESKFKKAHDNVKTAEVALKSAAEQLGDAQSNLAIAEGNEAAMQANFDNIKAQLRAVGDDTAKKAILEAQFVEAQSKLLKAKQETKDAKTNLTNAEGYQKEKENAYTTQRTNLKQQQEACKEAEIARDNAKKEMEQVNKELDDLQKDINTADSAIKKYETAQKDKEALEAQITQQGVRLKTLQQEEKTKYEALKTENQGLTQSIDGEVDTKKESKATQKIHENNQEMQEMMKDAKAGILKGPAENIAGTEFRTGKGPDGSDIYMIDDKAVTKGEYETKKAELKPQQDALTELANWTPELNEAGMKQEDGKSVRVCGGKEFRMSTASDGKKVRTIDGKAVTEKEFNAGIELAQKASKFSLEVGKSVVINGEKFEVTADGEYKHKGIKKSAESFGQEIKRARDAEADSKKAANMKNTLIQAQVNPEGTTVGNTKVNINVDTATGQITYTIGDKTNLTKAQFDEEFKKLFA